MKAKPGQLVGDHELCGRIAAGGMGEVWMARRAGPGGFRKLVVVKLVRDTLVGDARALEMFLNEARLAALINHPNVVQIFELGQDGGRWFLAMEYLDGRSLSRALRALPEGRLPVALAARVVADAAAGLDHAHRLTDAAGRPLGLVHRDVTPQNLVVTYAGQVKVVDFGIAKARVSADLTEAGAIKGKVPYLAPEVLEGARPDRAIDIYGLGVVLYQLALGRLPFTGADEAAIARAALSGRFARPRDLDPGFPAALSEIVARAIARERSARPATAGALRDELEGFLAGRPDGSGYHLGRLMEDTFPADRDEERVRLRRIIAALDDPTLITPLASPSPEAQAAGEGDAEVPPGRAAAEDPTDRVAVEGGDRTDPDPTEVIGTTDLARALDAAGGAATQTLASAAGLRARRRTWLIAAAVTAAAAAATTGVGAWRVWPERAVPPAPAAAAPASPAAAPAPRSAAPPAVARYRSPLPSAPQVEAIPAARPLDAPAAPAQTRTAPPRPAAASGPRPRAPAPRGTLDPRGEPAPRAAPEPPRVAPVAPVAPVSHGLLDLLADPPCDVYRDGRRLGRTPLRGFRLPAGRHLIDLREPALGIDLPVDLTVPAGGRVERAVRVGKGRLHVRVFPWAYVWIDGRALGSTPLDPVELHEGRHEVRLRSPDRGERVERTRVSPGRLTELRVRLP